MGAERLVAGVTVATAVLGTFVGAVLGEPFGDRLGRKRALAVLGALCSEGALTASWGAFVAFRLLGGLGVGASSVVGPTYITEIAPAEKRGQMVVLGILMAYVSNFLLRGAGWQWMLGVEAVPAAAFLGLAFMPPESPR